MTHRNANDTMEKAMAQNPHKTKKPGKAAGLAAAAALFPSALFAVSLALAPSDRLQMADKMFAKGLHAEAEKEYGALRGEKSVQPQDVEFRLAECAHALGREKEASAIYGKLLRGNLPDGMRAVAQYRLACAKNDADLFLKSAETDPDGRYALFARLKRALILAKSEDPEKRREATGIFLDLSFSKDKSVAEESMYAAATIVYGEKRWNEASILFKRLAKQYPEGRRAKESVVPRAWSAFLAGQYQDCLAACGDSNAEDLAYLRGAAQIALGKRPEGIKELSKYIELYPRGRYVSAASLPVQRMKFDEAVKAGDMPSALQAAKLAVSLSDTPSDALRLAWAHERSGSAAEARAGYRRIAEKWPDNSAAGEAIFANALLDLRDGNWAAGELALEEVLNRFPMFPRRGEALYWRGVAAIRLGHDESGAELLKEALKTGLTLDQAREANLLIADSDARAGRTKEAAARYAELVSKGACDRMSAKHLAAVAKILCGCEEWEAALAAARALSARSGDPFFVQVAAVREGMAYEGLSRFDEAIAAYRRAFSVKAETEEGAEAALLLGLLEYRKGEYAAAEKTLTDAVRRNSGPAGLKARAKAYRALADVCRANGEALKAKGYETVLKELFGDEG